MENKQIQTQSLNGATTTLKKIKEADNSKTIGESTKDDIILVFQNIFVLIGISQKLLPPKVAMDVLIDFLIRNQSRTPLAEIKLAFELAIAKKIQVDLKLFGETFSPKMIMEVYDAYRKYKHSLQTRLKIETKEVELTPEEIISRMKKAVIRCFNQYKDDKVLQDAGNVVYQYLYTCGEIKLTKEKKDEIVEAVKQILLEKERQKTNPTASAIEMIKKGTTPLITFEAKRYALKQYFDNLIEMEIDINEIIN